MQKNMRASVEGGAVASLVLSVCYCPLLCLLSVSHLTDLLLFLYSELLSTLFSSTLRLLPFGYYNSTFERAPYFMTLIKHQQIHLTLSDCPCLSVSDRQHLCQCCFLPITPLLLLHQKTFDISGDIFVTCFFKLPEKWLETSFSVYSAVSADMAAYHTQEINTGLPQSMCFTVFV